MPFITQGKNNWKFLLIVIILAIIVGGGALWLLTKEKIPSPEFKKSETVVINPKVNLETTKLVTLPGEYKPRAAFAHNKIPPGIYVIEIVFSPDGYQVAYVLFDTQEDKETLVVNGQERESYDYIDTLTFSPDGKQLAHRAHKGIYGTEGRKEFVVVNGQEGKPYERVDELTLTFSPDSKKLAYVGCETNKCFLIINGVEEKAYSLVKGKTSSISNLTFSPDSQKLAYVISNEEGYSLIINGEEVAKYPSNSSKFTWLTHLAFSPDSKKLVYTVCSEKTVSSIWEGGYECYPVINGEKWKIYSMIYEGPIFSSDSKSVAFATGNCVILNDKEKCYWGAVMYLIFSPNSRRFVYDATTGIGEGGIVINDKVEKIDFAFEPLAFSPDSNLLVGYGDRQLILLTLDETGIKVIKKGKSYNSIFTETTSFTPDGKHITYGAMLNNELWWIVDEVVKFGQ